MKQTAWISSLLLILLLSGVSPLFAQSESAAQRFAQANEWYQKGDYDQASEIYQGLVEEGLQSAALYFNIGNCAFKRGEIGQAVANYLRAERLAPRDEDVAENLRFVRSLLADQALLQTKRSFTGELFYGLRDHLTLRELFLSALGCFWLVCLFLAFTLWTREVSLWRQILWLFLLLYLVAGSLTYAKYMKLHEPMGVIVVPSVSVLSGPDSGTELFTVNEGSTAMIQRSQGDWVQIGLVNGLSGWVEKKSLEMI